MSDHHPLREELKEIVETSDLKLLRILHAVVMQYNSSNKPET